MTFDVQLHTDFIHCRNRRHLIGYLWEPDITPFPEMAVCGPELSPDDLHPDDFARHAQEIWALSERYPTDIPQPVGATFGIPWLQAAVGCRVLRKGNVIWAEPTKLTYEELHSMRFDLAQPWIEKMLECHRAVAQAAEASGNAMSLPVMAGPMDILSAFRGPGQFCLDLYDHPGEVHAALKTLTNFWIEVGLALGQTVPLYHGGMCTRMHLWFPADKSDQFVAITPEADVASLLSSEMYREFGLPVDRHILEEFPIHTYHSHSTGAHIFDDLIDTSLLRSLQITLDPNGLAWDELVVKLRQIQQKIPLLLCVWTMDDFRRCLECLDPEGIAIALIVKGEDDMGTLIQFIKEEKI